MSLFEHFFKFLSLSLEGRRRIRIRIKVKGRIRIHIEVTSRIRIRIRINVMRSATLFKSINKSSLLHEYCMLLFFEGGGGRVCSMAKKKGGPPGLLAGNHGRKMVLTNWFPEGKWCERRGPGCQLISIMVYRWFSPRTCQCHSYKFIPLILDKSQL